MITRYDLKLILNCSCKNVNTSFQFNNKNKSLFTALFNKKHVNVGCHLYQRVRKRFEMYKHVEVWSQTRCQGWTSRTNVWNKEEEISQSDNVIGEPFGTSKPSEQHHTTPLLSTSTFVTYMVNS